jgi:hypothetical protein
MKLVEAAIYAAKIPQYVVPSVLRPPVHAR